MSAGYTRHPSPALTRAVQGDLEGLAAALLALAPGASLRLGGSYALGEAVAWMEGGALRSLSDYDLFLHLPGPSGALRPRALRAALPGIAARLHNPRLDLNLILAGPALSAGWAQPTLPLLAGPPLPPREPDPGARFAFALHALHEAQQGLLACAPVRALAAPWRRFAINRCAAGVLRAAWNLEAPAPCYSLLACGDALDGDWARGFGAETLALFRTALGENPGLGLVGAAPLTPGALVARWVRARRAVERLHERWHHRISLADPARGRALWRERVKGSARLALGASRRRRLPGLVLDVHPLLFEARRALLEAVLPSGGIDQAWLARAQARLGRTGLGPRRWPVDPTLAWEVARRVSALPNPLRLTVEIGAQ